MIGYMQHALTLAGKALGNVSPNPAVGAVVVREGRIVGEGYTQPPGSAHAEIMALRQAGELARGATMYVTLEPCCHFGRTPPCADAIIESGIREVHMAMLDPNPIVSGQGKAKLDDAGIDTHVGEHEEEAREIVEAYIKYITTRTPFVTAKFAMSLDGKIATKKFDSKWISNDWSREHAHRLRWEADAVMVGVNTVLNDNPELTARTVNGMKEPLRIIVDSFGRTPLDAKALVSPDRVVLATTNAIALDRLAEYQKRGIEVLKFPEKEKQVDLAKLLKALGKREITSVLVEGGGTLLGSMFDFGMVDKVVAFIAPVIIGGKEAISPVEGNGVNLMSQALRLTRVKVDRVMDDIMVVGYTR